MRTFAPVCTPPETISKIYGGVFDLPRLLNELEELEQESAQPDFWKNAHIATRVGRRKATIERDIARVADFEQRQTDLEATLDVLYTIWRRVCVGLCYNGLVFVIVRSFGLQAIRG